MAVWAFFHVLSALALLCFVAHLHWRMRGESNRALVWAGGGVGRDPAGAA